MENMKFCIWCCPGSNLLWQKWLQEWPGEELPIALTKFKTVDEAVQFSVKAVCELDLGDGQGFQGSLGIGTRTPSLTAAANFVRFAVITHEYKL
jgi:hypothetical protein